MKKNLVALEVESCFEQNVAKDQRRAANFAFVVAAKLSSRSVQLFSSHDYIPTRSETIM